MTHNKMVENGDEVVDIADCKVEAIYYNKESEKGFRKPNKNITVRDIIEFVSQERGRDEY